MKFVLSEKKKERSEGNVIGSVKAITVVILGINPPLFETDARPRIGLKKRWIYTENDYGDCFNRPDHIAL